MRLVTLPDKIVRTDHYTLLVMRDGARCQAVCVSNTRRIGDVDTKLGLIEAIASGKLDRGEIAFDGRVWITPTDLPHRHIPDGIDRLRCGPSSLAGGVLRARLDQVDHEGVTSCSNRCFRK